jgi:hypothetical protein
MAKTPTEKSLYPLVEKWMKKHFLCFKVAINTGLKYSRVDVLGIRDVGGDLSGEVETIVIEVKRGTQAFATASGQALGYKVYGNRVYLADYRYAGFTQDEINIASHLGIGLIKIWNKNCTEVLSSPYYKPIAKLNLALLEKMSLGVCQFCNSVFETGSNTTRYSKVARENINSSIKNEKGIVFWNREVAARKRKLGIRVSENYYTYERRFICPDCVKYLIAQFKDIRD